jgi:hypothetical protein|tara:strand:- start:14984 stop:16171 length:1188 start_codon:yes stop_codon:yes gene_type:complete
MPSTDNKADMLFKIALGFADTGNAPGKTNSKEFYAEGIPSRPTVYSSSVWSEVDKIPVDAPGMTDGEISGVLQYYEDRTMSSLATSAKGFYLADLRNSVPFNFGNPTSGPNGTGYGYTIKNSAGTQVQFGQGDWVLDTSAGILQFYGDLPNGVTREDPPTISFYKYIGKTGGGGGASITISNNAPADADAGSMWWNSDTGDLLLRYQDTDSTQWVSAIGGAGGFFELNSATNTISTPYNLTAPSKNFRIPHPLPSLSDDYILMHTSVEAPEATLLYRGRVQLTNGRATVNIDEHSRMTEGTFVALSHNPNCHISNNVDWTPVRGRVEGNILTIEAKESDCNVEVEWLVTCARRDLEIYKLPTMDVDGVYHPEVLKATLAREPKQHIDPIKLEFKE